MAWEVEDVMVVKVVVMTGLRAVVESVSRVVTVRLEVSRVVTVVVVKASREEEGHLVGVIEEGYLAIARKQYLMLACLDTYFLQALWHDG